MSNIGEASTYFFRVPDADPKKAFLRWNVCAESSVNIKRVAADVPAVPWRRVVNRSRRERSPANLSLPFWPGRCHKTRMDKHSRASSRRGKGKSKRLSAVGRKRLSRRQVVPDQWVELATDAIRDGHTTVDSFVALFHPEVRFTAFRAYMAAMVSFTAKVAMVAPSARRAGQRRPSGSRKLA